jgi:hypothetical protein
MFGTGNPIDREGLADGRQIRREEVPEAFEIGGETQEKICQDRIASDWKF